MKKTTLFILLLILTTYSFSQTINWQHTNGNEGIANGSLWNDDEYAYYSDEVFVYRTKDGNLWEKVSETNIIEPASYKNTMVAFSKSNSVIYQRLIVLSEDQGETWEKIPFPSVNFTYPASVTVCSHGIYLSVYNTVLQEYKIVKTNDKGKTWQNLTVPSNPTDKLLQIDNRVYYFAGRNLYRSDSTGLKWEKCSASLYSGESFQNVIGKYPMLALISDKNIRVWNQAQNTWHIFNSQLLDLRTTIEYKDTLYSYSSPGKILYSTDFGLTWNNKFNTTGYKFEKMAKLPETFLIQGSNTAIFKYEIDSLGYANNGLNSGISTDLVNNGKYLFSQNSFNHQRYDFAQKTWNPLPKVGEYYEEFNKVVCNQNGVVVLYNDFTIRNFYVSEDNGNNFYKVKPPNAINYNKQRLFVMDSTIFYADDLNSYSYNIAQKTWKPSFDLKTNPEFYSIYNMVKFKGQLFGVLQKYSSTLDFKTITAFESSKQLDSFIIDSDFQPSYFMNTEDKLFCIGYQKSNKIKVLFVSDDGITWQKSNLSDRFYMEKVIGIKNKIIGYTSNYGTQLISFDGGVNWQEYTFPLFRYSFSLHNNQLYAGGIGNGVFATDFDAFFKTVSIESDRLSEQMLNTPVEVFPNPTVDMCVLRLTDKSDYFTNIEYYNVNGQFLEKQEYAYSVNEISLLLNRFKEQLIILKIKTSKGVYLHKVLKID